MDVIWTRGLSLHHKDSFNWATSVTNSSSVKTAQGWMQWKCMAQNIRKIHLRTSLHDQDRIVIAI